MGTMDALLIALLALTGVIGLVDAVSFLEPGLSVARSSASLVSFLVGATVGGSARDHHGRSRPSPLAPHRGGIGSRPPLLGGVRVDRVRRR